ncbi:RHS repeat protein [Flavobacterium sp. LPB0248]|uniref:RHS repeat domain-containing protein n=1 Tax=Flavobacterium sp. LPB0248 TaxID=2614441 RepID=UPI0015A62225|nr:RHS repeat domain-containing protein [Flavobacterium sp. LPB0248]QLC65928.1 RHS repeat protein [Flavobacterium sp. LPB0248]
MKRNIILIILVFSFISCRNIEENNLLRYSEENKSYQIIKSVKYLNEKDSLISGERKLVCVYDSKDRLINTNNNSFNFYNSKNKLSETKSVYKRKGNCIILNMRENKYFYNEKGNLIKIVNPADNENVIKTFEYDEFGNLISEVGFRETIKYEYSNGKVSKKTIFENSQISKKSQFK